MKKRAHIDIPNKISRMFCFAKIIEYKIEINRVGEDKFLAVPVPAVYT
jgi:hypothetical protein